MKNSKSTILAVFGILSMTAGNAYAYLDPGSGSFILQAIVTALIGSALAIKVFWQRVKAFFARLLTSGGGTEESTD